MPQCVPCRAPNEIDYRKKNVEINSGAAVFSVFSFSDSIITLEMSPLVLAMTVSSYGFLEICA